MPTVPVYVPIKVARQIASRWQVPVNDHDLVEVIRSVCMEALDYEAGISTPVTSFSEECEWKHIHHGGRRCRHCGGSS